MVVAILNTSWLVSEAAPQEPTTGPLALRLFGETGFVLTVEIAAVLLLAAILGAIVMVRER
jgi:NADH:ubiquinone oxidoreductase subunit 6 (subunit J)